MKWLNFVRNEKSIYMRFVKNNEKLNKEKIKKYA